MGQLLALQHCAGHCASGAAAPDEGEEGGGDECSALQLLLAAEVVLLQPSQKTILKSGQIPIFAASPWS